MIWYQKIQLGDFYSVRRKEGLFLSNKPDNLSSKTCVFTLVILESTTVIVSASIKSITKWLQLNKLVCTSANKPNTVILG